MPVSLPPENFVPEQGQLRLVYRAIWQDDRSNLTELARADFINWEGGLRSRLDDGVGPLHSETHGGDAASLIEMTLSTSCDLGVIHTTMHVLSEENGGWIWVDAESSIEEDRLDEPLGKTIQLVASLIDSGVEAQGQPHVVKTLLHSKPVAINPREPEAYAKLAQHIFSDERKTPVVIFANDPIDGPGPTMHRATTAANLLAGVAQVLVLPDPIEAISLFQKEMGIELDVQPGEARLYMPYAPDRIPRHPVFAAHQIRTNFTEVCRRLLSILRPALVATEPPAVFDLQQKSAESRRGRDDVESSLEEQIGLLTEELDASWETLLSTRKQRTEAVKQRAEAFNEITKLQDELQNSIDDSFEKQDQINSLQDALVLLLENRPGDAPAAIGVPKSKALADKFTQISDVLDYTNEHLTYVEVHPDAGMELERLDRDHHRDLWIRAILDGLQALGAYARSAVEDDYRYKNFQDWCTRSNHPFVWPDSTKKLSMNESEEVKRRPELKSHRKMPVSTEVHEAGVIAMEAHLKLSNSGPAPRLYFYDDTAGKTRLIHVGYVGPHLPTKRRN